MDIRKKQFLIIAGQPKAGTTSLFEWLKDHPDVCGAKLKETRFFLDEDYPLRRPLKFDGKNIDAYADLFEDSSKSILMEATPDYLYCRTPLQLAKLLPHSRIVVVLRDPVDRMVSAYRFYIQRGLIDTSMTFDEYIEYQDSILLSQQTPVQFRALDHCRVNFYLRDWKAIFGDRLLVLDFNDLRRNGYTVMDNVCQFLGIPVVSGERKELGPENKTVKARWPIVSRVYYPIRRELSILSLKYPFLKTLLRPVNQVVKRGLIDDSPLEKFVPSDRSVEIIRKWAAV